MSKAFIQYLPVPAETANVTALASQRIERFVPANTAISFTLTNQPINDFLLVFKNGLLLDPGAVTPDYTVAGKLVALRVAANGTDVYQARYQFRV